MDQAGLQLKWQCINKIQLTQDLYCSSPANCIQMDAFSRQMHDALRFLDPADLQKVLRATPARIVSRPAAQDSLLLQENMLLQNQAQRLQSEIEQLKEQLQSGQRLQVLELTSQLKVKEEQVRRLEQQGGLVRQVMQQVRDMLAGLVPENVYLRLKSVPEWELATSEWLLREVWELAFPFKQECEQYRRQVAQLREQVRTQTDEYHRVVSELQHASRMYKSKDEDLQRYRLDFDTNRKGLEMELEAYRKELELLREKSLSLDLAHKREESLIRDKELLEEKVNFYSGKRGSESLSQEDVGKQLGLLESALEAAKKERDHLTQLNLRLKGRLDRTEHELLVTKDNLEKAMSQLLNYRTETSVQFQKKLDVEIAEAKRRAQFEVENMRSYYTDNYEKQIRFLKDEKEDLDFKLAIKEREISEKKKMLEDALLKTRELEQTLQNQTAKLRAELLLKKDQFNSVNSHYEIALGQVKVFRAENQLLEERAKTIKQEYRLLQARAKEEAARLKEQLATASDEAAHLGQITQELAKSMTLLEGADSKSQVGPEGYIRRKRLQQALTISQRIVKLQETYEASQTKFKKMSEQLAVANSQLDSLRRLNHNATQPLSYLAQHISQLEGQISKFTKQLNKRDQHEQRLRSEYNTLLEEYKAATSKLEKVEAKGKNVSGMLAMLLGMFGEGKSPERAQLQAASQQLRDVLQLRQQGQLPNWASKLRARQK